VEGHLQRVTVPEVEPFEAEEEKPSA
jgi:hypothetical protein